MQTLANADDKEVYNPHKEAVHCTLPLLEQHTDVMIDYDNINVHDSVHDYNKYSIVKADNTGSLLYPVSYLEINYC